MTSSRRSILKAGAAAAALTGIGKCSFIQWMTFAIPIAAILLVAGGAANIVVMPMFIAQGGHLKREVPEMLDRLRSTWPEVRFSLGGAIGERSVWKNLSGSRLRLREVHRSGRLVFEHEWSTAAELGQSMAPLAPGGDGAKTSIGSQLSSLMAMMSQEQISKEAGRLQGTPVLKDILASIHASQMNLIRSIR